METSRKPQTQRRSFEVSKTEPELKFAMRVRDFSLTETNKCLLRTDVN
jgi:hypothetical protein